MPDGFDPRRLEPDAGRAAPAEPWHPDPTASSLPGSPDVPFPQTGWSATVMDAEGSVWQSPADEPGPSYQWADPWRPVTPSAASAPESPATSGPSASPARVGRRLLPGSRLGVTAFGLVTAMTLACVYLAWCAGRCAGMAMVAFSTPVFDPMEIIQAAPTMSDHFSALCGLGFLASLVGVTGLVMAVVARLRNSAPSLSLTAVIIGLCTPMLAFIALLAATEPFIHQMS